MPPLRRTVFRIRRCRTSASPYQSPLMIPPLSHNNTRSRPSLHPRSFIERSLELFNSSSSLRGGSNGALGPEFRYHENTGCFVSEGPRPSVWLPIYIGGEHVRNEEQTQTDLVERTTIRYRLESTVDPSGRTSANEILTGLTRLGEETRIGPADNEEEDSDDDDDDDDNEEDEAEAEDEEEDEEERLRTIGRELEARVFAPESFDDNHAKADDDDDDREVCAICLDELSTFHEEKKVKFARLDCRHKYHLECIRNWVLKNNVCPICKRQALQALNS